MSRARGCMTGIALGSVFRAIFYLIGVVVKVLASVLVFTGLWVPAVYALLGGILYLIYHFDPLNNQGLYEYLYLTGAIITVVIALIIFIRNLIVKPIKKAVTGDDGTEPWKKKKEKKKKEKSEERGEWVPKKRLFSRQKEEKPEEKVIFEEPVFEKKEEPNIYLSAVEENTLIHEYSDRFEVYKLVNGRAIRDKVEYKNG